MLLRVGILNNMITSDIKSIENQLRQYANEYYANEFVPFPTVQDAVDAVLETVGYINIEDRSIFVSAVIELLTEWHKKEIE